MKYSYSLPASLRMQARIIAALEVPLCAADLAELVHTGERNVSRYLTYMAGLPIRQIRISGWVQGARGSPAALYSRGCEADAPRPVPLSPSQVNRNWRARQPYEPLAALYRGLA